MAGLKFCKPCTKHTSTHVRFACICYLDELWHHIISSIHLLVIVPSSMPVSGVMEEAGTRESCHKPINPLPLHPCKLLAL